MAYSLWRYFSFSAEYTVVPHRRINRSVRMQNRSIKMTSISQPTKLVWQISTRRRTGKQPESAPVAETRLNVVLRGIALVPDPAR